MADSPPLTIDELKQLRERLRKPGVLNEVVPWYFSANQLIRLTRWTDGEFVSIDDIIGLEKILLEISQIPAGKTIAQPKRPGRKPENNPEKDQSFANAWQTARDTGVSFKKFCNDWGLRYTKLGKRILDRVRDRIRKPKRKRD